MKLSIVIPCLNEEKYITSCIHSVWQNDFPKDQYEIIVVDGGSMDNTLAILKELQSEAPVPMHLLHNPLKIPPTAMNIGIEKAAGELIMRLDTHAAYPTNYISTLVAYKEKLQADNIGAVAITEVLNETKTSVAIKKVLSHKFGVGGGLFRTGTDKITEVDTVPFGCYSKSRLLALGGYDERLKRNQDIELNKRLIASGGKILLVPFTHCVYFAREKWRKFAKNNFDNGKWNLITAYYTKNFASLSLRHFIPLFFVLSLILPALLSLVFWPFIFFSLLSIGLYFLTLIVVISKMDRKGTTFFHLLWTFVVLHISYGMGSFIGLFHFTKYFQR